MKVTSNSVIAATYSLELAKDNISILLAGEEVARLIPYTVMNTTNDDDETFAVDIDSADVVFEKIGDATFTWTSSSNLWEKKVYTLTCFEKRFEYTVTVYGKGRIDTVNYFRHNFEDGNTQGSNHEFCEGFYPDVHLGAGDGTYLPNKGYSVYSCLSVPPMFYHSYKTAGIPTYLGFGVVASMGEHNFTLLGYEQNRGFSWYTDQYGHVTVDGEWTTPKMVVYTADDHLDAGKKYCDLYFDGGICERGDNSKKPRFWYGPIACGWIEQTAFGMGPNGDGTSLLSCKEPAYREMLRMIEVRDLHPSILIIDDKWQDEYGTAYASPERWPDLRGFIDETFETKGIRTMMWYQLWNADGLPEECLTIDEEGSSYIKGNRPVADPSHPVYQKMLKEIVHRIISPDEGCYNAYGFKLDFAFCQPHGRKVKTYSGKYGAELLYDYIKQIRDYAKEAKPDAVINASPCHPMFASLVDHARLHDYDGDCRNGKEIFEFRAKLWGMANPTSLIDTDSGGFNTHRDMMRVMKNQPAIGIPDIYAVSDLPWFKFTEDEWKTISTLWKEYNDKIDKMFE